MARRGLNQRKYTYSVKQALLGYDRQCGPLLCVALPVAGFADAPHVADAAEPANAAGGVVEEHSDVVFSISRQ